MLGPNHLHRALSPFLHASGAYAWNWKRIAHASPRTIVLCYHRVLDDDEPRSRLFDIERGTRASDFEAQMRFMLRHFEPVRPSELMDAGHRPIRFAVTFDDGYEDNFRVARPILSRLGIPAAFYVVTDFVGTDRLFWWEKLATVFRESPHLVVDLRDVDPGLPASAGLRACIGLDGFGKREVAFGRISRALRGVQAASIPGRLERLADVFGVPLPEGPRPYPLMGWDQLRTLSSEGFEIGSHSATHPRMAGLQTGQVEAEVSQSIAAIERQLGTRVLTFAFPYGRHDGLEAVEAVRRSGCRLAFAGGSRTLSGKLKRFELPRLQLTRPDAFACAYRIQNALDGTAGRAPRLTPDVVAPHEQPGG